MKKILIAIFIAILMLMVPVTTVGKTINKPEKINNFEEAPKIYITEEERIQLNEFIENNFEGDNKVQAYTIVNDVINEDLEVDLVELSNALIQYTYNPIPQELLDNVASKSELNQLIYDYWGVTPNGFVEKLFGSLINKIIEIIKDRLGWFYQLFKDGTKLFYDGITLFVDIIKPAALVIALLFVNIVNEILSAPQVFADAIKELFQLEYDNFLDILTSFTHQFNEDLNALIDAIIEFISNPDIESYLTEIQDFIGWLDENPWEDPIKVSGGVTLNFLLPFEGATITCLGQSDMTDSNGRFEFYVDPYPREDSFPPNKLYGMHNCEVTVSKDGEVLKQSPKLLSYVFSGGEISWEFFVVKSKTSDRRIILFEIFENLIKNIQSLFPNLLRIIRGTYTGEL